MSKCLGCGLDDVNGDLAHAGDCPFAPCPSCNGRGATPDVMAGDDELRVTCPDCAGTGKAANAISETERRERAHFKERVLPHVASIVDQLNEIIRGTCADCGGRGFITTTYTTLTAPFSRTVICPSCGIDIDAIEALIANPLALCEVCQGTGGEASGVEYMGVHEIVGCQECEGTGYAASSALRTLLSRLTL